MDEVQDKVDDFPKSRLFRVDSKLDVGRWMFGWKTTSGPARYSARVGRGSHPDQRRSAADNLDSLYTADPGNTFLVGLGRPPYV